MNAFALKSLAVLSVLLSHSVTAGVLVMKNGDRISGEIKQVWDGEITIEPGYSDKFSVDVPAVNYIESEREFEIELEDGRNIVAQLLGADASGNQIVKTRDGTISIELAQLFSLDEPEEAFDWGSNVEFSTAINSGNTDSSNTKIRADGTVKLSDHRHIGEVTVIREEQDGDTTKDQDLLRYNYNWFFRDPWFLSAQLSFEQDPIIELEERVITSAGVGRDIWDTPRRALSVQLGGGSQTEKITTMAGTVSTDSTVLTWSLRYRQDLFDGDLELYHNHSITTNVSGRTNTSYKTTTGLRYEITDLLFANLSVDFDYETDPVEAVENEDIALLAGVGLEF